MDMVPPLFHRVWTAAAGARYLGIVDVIVGLEAAARLSLASEAIHWFAVVAAIVADLLT